MRRIVAVLSVLLLFMLTGCSLKDVGGAADRPFYGNFNMSVTTTSVSVNVTSNTTAHNLLSNLDYVSAGHTGFEPTIGFTPENPANKGAVNGYASLNATGKVPSAQIDFPPAGSEVDPVYTGDPAFGITAADILNWNSNSIPDQSGNATKYLYTDGSSLLWNTPAGSNTDNYTVWNETTANLTTHTANTLNPHSVTAAQIGALSSSNLTNGQLDGGVSRAVYIACIANTTTLATGNGTANFTVPAILNGMNLVAVDASVYTVSSSGNITLTVYNATDSHTMLSTSVTIESNELTSYTATTSSIVNTSYDDVTSGDWLRIDVSAVGTGTKGLDVFLTFRKP